MTELILSGCNGKMGRVITACAAEDSGINIVAGVDADAVMPAHYPVFASFDELRYQCDVLLDFSHPAALPDLLCYAKATQTPAVIATTGYDEAAIAAIRAAAETVPIFFTFNMSLGINLLAELAKKAAQVLTGFDIEIVEAHHSAKIDAPSGTALMLADAVRGGLDEPTALITDRSGRRESRPKNEIGIHAIRGGTIVGDHQVIFAGRDEIITLSHSARSKELFAVGALRAAHFLAGKPAGLYTMADLIGENA